jgi:xylitol oxidase
MIPGAAANAAVHPVPGDKPHNWAGNYAYSSSPVHTAHSIEEAQALVKKHPRLKVLGTRHCFNNIADSNDQLISLAPLNKIISLDKNNHTVTIEAGVRYGELATALQAEGYALHNLASLPHISVVGGCATATHGSGVRNAGLPAAVQAISFIAASGDIVELSRRKDPAQFPGAVVHLGGLGVVTGITLQVQPAYSMRQYVYQNLPMQQLAGHFTEIMSAGYSVSLFTGWRNKNIDEVWIKCTEGEEPPPVLFGATAATQNLHPIRHMPAQNCTEQMGVAGPWHERLPHFRMGFTPSSGTELQSEYFVPVSQSYEAIQAIERLHEKIAPHLLISEIRCIAADDLWMSPCYRQASTAIHFTWQQNWPAVRQLLPLIEEALAPFNAKPHWGKLFTTSPGRISQLYEQLPAFRQLLEHYDPQGKFRNEYLDTVIFGG